MRTARTRCLAVTVAGLLSLAACGETDDSDAATTASTAATATTTLTATVGDAGDAAGLTLVGDLQHSTTKLGLFVKGDKVWGYLCDPAGAARAVNGTLNDGTVALTEADGTTTVTGRLDGGSFTGTVSLDGKGHEVTATKATGDAGVFMLFTTSGDTSELGAWIRDADGEVVGNVTTFTGKDGGIEVSEAPGGDPGSEPVPAKIGDRFRCFQAGRKLIKARESGITNAIVEAQLDMQTACNNAFDPS